MLNFIHLNLRDAISMPSDFNPGNFFSIIQLFLLNISSKVIVSPARAGINPGLTGGDKPLPYVGFVFIR